jgi:hypothetical protein
LRAFEIRVLRGISIQDEEWRELQYEEIRDLYSSPYITRIRRIQKEERGV